MRRRPARVSDPEPLAALTRDHAEDCGPVPDSRDTGEVAAVWNDTDLPVSE
jgi:hypothetical protein